MTSAHMRSIALLSFLAAIAGCAASADAEDDALADSEEDLSSACDLGTTCPGSTKLLSARSFDKRPAAQMRGDLEVVTNEPSLDRIPRRFAQTTSRSMTFRGGAAVLAGDAAGTKLPLVDDILLVEVLDTNGVVLAAGAYGGVSVRQNGALVRVLAAAPSATAGRVGVDIAPLLPRDKTFRLRVSALDVAGIAHTTDVFLRADATAPSYPLIDFAWSYDGPIAGKHCIQINEPADRHGESAGHRPWTNNFLCTDRDFGLRWSYAGQINGMMCLSMNEVAEPGESTWADNFLCTPSDYRLTWSTAGAIAGQACTKIAEPSDRYTWGDNYLCQARP
jgi:hypothetical protein